MEALQAAHREARGMDGHSRLHPASPSGLGEISISLPSSRRPAFSLNQVRSYLPKAGKACPRKDGSAEKRPRALQDGGGKGKEGPSLHHLVPSPSLSLTVASAGSSPALQKAALTGQEACRLHLPGETGEASQGRPSLEVPVATAFKTPGKLA